jgi:plasmid stability protein
MVVVAHETSRSYYRMSMLQRRLQVLIDDDLHERLLAAARDRGMSVEAVVREAIEGGLASPDAAGARTLAAIPMDVPAVDDLVTELNDLRGRRG